jgi:hypothetical protein
MAGKAGKVAASPYMVVPATVMGIAGEPVARLLGQTTGDVVNWFRGGNPNEIPVRQAMGMNRQNAIVQQLRNERLQEAKTMNMMRLMKMDPHLYSELTAGRPLPIGAVPIGGSVKTDLLDEVTGAMANGDFSPPPMM